MSLQWICFDDDIYNIRDLQRTKSSRKKESQVILPMIKKFDNVVRFNFVWKALERDLWYLQLNYGTDTLRKTGRETT